MSRYIEMNRAAVLDLWATRRYDTSEIAHLLTMRECDVARRRGAGLQGECTASGVLG